MFEKFKYLFTRLTKKIEGNLAKDEVVVDFQDLERTRRKLVDMRFKKDTCETTGSFSLDSVRRRMTEETDVVSLRNAKSKWFGTSNDQTESGCFDTTELNSRLEQNARREDDPNLEPLPAIEDTFMAFSRADDNLFGEESSTLSGIHYKIDPVEDFEDEYTVPALPFYGQTFVDQNTTQEDLDVFEETAEEEKPIWEITGNNPMIQVLSELEERMAANQQRNQPNLWLAGEN